MSPQHIDDEERLLHHDERARGLGFRADVAEANGGLNGKREIDCIDERRVFVQAREMRITDFSEHQVTNANKKIAMRLSTSTSEYYYKGDILIDAALVANHEAKLKPGVICRVCSDSLVCRDTVSLCNRSTRAGVGNRESKAAHGIM